MAKSDEMEALLLSTAPPTPPAQPIPAPPSPPAPPPPEPVPADVASLLSRQLLSHFGPALAKLGIISVANLAQFSEAELTEHMPKMRLGEVKRLIAAAKAA